MLEELQSLSEAKKKHVIVIATIIIMVIIVGVWVAYFNSIIIGTAQQASAPVLPPPHRQAAPVCGRI